VRVTGELTRLKITVSGIVQGVGFRPFVFNLAGRLALSGYVRNNNGAVEIEAQGPAEALEAFLHRLESEAPPLAAITSMVSESVSPQPDGPHGFLILESARDPSTQRFLPPDSATCADCLAELFDPADRRFRYPFINCTNCGPRFTIINSLPYDRPATTMASFPMCKACRDEYEDPANRRFHAQPNACPQCGPSLEFAGATDPVPAVLDAFANSQIIAVKGLGGFHLMCDAADEKALRALRQRKGRSRKPFAVMMADVEMVRSYCQISYDEQRELTGSRRPIVLLRRSGPRHLPDEIAPGIDRLGVMLPYTPLHHLLLRDYQRPLVATSANYNEEPIAIENAEARRRLAKIADGFLTHNRDIRSRYDDSVVKFAGRDRLAIRRARGLAPLPIQLSFKARRHVLACGAHLKNTFCLIRDNQAFVSQHIGDLENLETHEHFQDTLDTYLRLFDFQPDLISHDCHPDYLSTSIAQELAAQWRLPLVAAQHHHAHIVSCMAEHGLMEPVIGVAFDGLGYGPDATLWGGEFLVCSPAAYKRAAYLKPYPLPGGSRGIKQPWRMALSYICADGAADAVFLPFLRELESEYGSGTVETIKSQIAGQLNSPLTSSCGRLFDAVSALLGICRIADYEGQAAMELQAAVTSQSVGSDRLGAYPFDLLGDEPPFSVLPAKILQAAYRDVIGHAPPAVVAARFHSTVARIILDVCLKLRELTRIQQVCLSGGVFQNDLLLQLARELLAADGFQVFSASQLPANDGGLSLGQAVIALANSDGLITAGN